MKTIALCVAALFVGAAAAQSAKPVNLWSLRKQLATADDDHLTNLESQLVAMFGAEKLANGTAPPRVDGLLALFATTADAKAVSEYDGKMTFGNGGALIKSHPLVRHGRIALAFVELSNCTDRKFQYSSPNRTYPQIFSIRTEVYPPHPDSVAKPDVPKGNVTKRFWKSQIFAQTERDYWVYVPAQYKPEESACLMVFQDGESYLKSAAAATVFDNLIYRGELPVTVGVFINPGTIPRASGQPRSNRSFEYDSLSDAYARFLRDEILPEVGKSVKLRSDANSRAICGRSSGGICAFTVAWEQPDQFGKVLSTIGSFTNIRGGDVYPGKIRKTPAKPIRVFLQDGSQDLDNEHGNWWLANQQMAKALAFKGYDYTFVTGQGFHSGKHEAAILPEALRWLWRDWKP